MAKEGLWCAIINIHPSLIEAHTGCDPLQPCSPEDDVDSSPVNQRKRVRSTSYRSFVLYIPKSNSSRFLPVFFHYNLHIIRTKMDVYYSFSYGTAAWLSLQAFPLVVSPTIIITLLSPDVREPTGLYLYTLLSMGSNGNYSD